MKRISFQNVHIDLLMQNEENIFEQKCLHGVMSTTPRCRIPSASTTPA